MKNAELLRSAEKEFDVWITADRNIEYQQNLSRFDIAIIVLIAPRNQLEFLSSPRANTPYSRHNASWMH